MVKADAARFCRRRASGRGIPNFWWEPDRIAAVRPTKIRYTFPSSGNGQDQVKLSGIVSRAVLEAAIMSVVRRLGLFAWRRIENWMMPSRYFLYAHTLSCRNRSDT